ncbi:STN domain-containing protein [Bacteroides fragilis]|nr:STN domain-containing protein [Bacteroides fragilis]
MKRKLIPLKMRLACILAFAIWFNLQAESVFSQTTVVSIRANQTSVENVLRAIEKQSGRYCVYNSKLINADRMVDIDLENCSIEEALDKLFKGTKVKYEINERHIIISPASTSIQQIKKSADTY